MVHDGYCRALSAGVMLEIIGPPRGRKSGLSHPSAGRRTPMFFVAVVVVVVVVVAVVLLLVLFMLVVGWWWWWCRLQWLCRNAVVAVVGVSCCCICRCFGGIHRTGEETHYRTGTKPQPLNPISFAKKMNVFTTACCVHFCVLSLSARNRTCNIRSKRGRWRAGCLPSRSTCERSSTTCGES